MPLAIRPLPGASQALARTGRSVVGRVDQRAVICSSFRGAPGHSVPVAAAETQILNILLDTFCGSSWGLETRSAAQLAYEIAQQFEAVAPLETATATWNNSPERWQTILDSDANGSVSRQGLHAELSRVLSAMPVNAAHRLKLLERVLWTSPTFAPGSRGVARSCAARQSCAHSEGKGLRVFALRHQRRSLTDASFFSPLLDVGLHDAEEVNRPALEALAPTQMYSSPLYRCLQTLEPYIKQQQQGNGRGLPVKVDYSLYEHNTNPEVMEEVNAEVGGAVLSEWVPRFSLDTAYTSLLHRHALPNSNRTLQDVHRRTGALVKHLALLYGQSEEVIVLATHQTIVHSLVHQATGQAMSQMNVQMGAMVELDWRAIVKNYGSYCRPRI